MQIWWRNRLGLNKKKFKSSRSYSIPLDNSWILGSWKRGPDISRGIEAQANEIQPQKNNSLFDLSCKYSLLPIPSGRQLKLDWSFIITNDTFSVQSTADVEASWIFCSLSFRCLLIFLRSQRLLSVNVLMLVFCLCVRYPKDMISWVSQRGLDRSWTMKCFQMKYH